MNCTRGGRAAQRWGVAALNAVAAFSRAGISRDSILPSPQKHDHPSTRYRSPKASECQPAIFQLRLLPRFRLSNNTTTWGGKRGAYKSHSPDEGQKTQLCDLHRGFPRADKPPPPTPLPAAFACPNAGGRAASRPHPPIRGTRSWRGRTPPAPRTGSAQRPPRGPRARAAGGDGENGHLA